MDDFKKFINQYKGAIIGVIIAIVLLATRLYDVIIGILIILAGALLEIMYNKIKMMLRQN